MSICCEDVPVDSAPSSDKEVGIDIGLKICADLSDGTTIENPRFFRQEEKNLAKAQRKRDKAPKKSKERTQLHKRVARVHERTKNRRKPVPVVGIAKRCRSRSGCMSAPSVGW